MYPNTRLKLPSEFFSQPSYTGTTLSPELCRTCPSCTDGGSCACERAVAMRMTTAPMMTTDRLFMDTPQPPDYCCCCWLVDVFLSRAFRSSTCALKSSSVSHT